jgi:hypothetical protein
MKGTLFCVAFALSAGCGAGNSTKPDPVVTLSSVSLSGTLSFTGLNQAAQLAALAEMSDQTTRDVSGLSVWQSSDGAVLAVSPSGLVTAIGYGTAAVAATYQGKVGSAQGTVPRPAVCDGSLTFSSRTVGSAGGTDTVGVTVSPAGCEWTATSGSLWIAVTAGSSGRGNGSVSYVVSSYSGSSQRQGTLEIAGKILVVRQDPPVQPPPPSASCQYGLTSPKTLSFGSQGGTGTVTFNLTSGSCTWTGSSSDPQWLTVQQQSGTGNITIGFSVAANPSSSGRSGRIEVRWPGPQVGENILVNQSGR